MKSSPQQLNSGPPAISLSRRIRKFILTPEGFFLLFSILFGVLFVFLTPPIQAPDEDVHFYQAYQISNLDLLPHKFQINGIYHYGAKLPDSVFDATETFKGNVAGYPDVDFRKSLFKQYLRQPLNPSKTEYKEGGNAYSSPIVYIPQAIGIDIGKVFQASPLILIWLGRLGNLAAWVALCYFSIKLLPFAKWALAVMALSPMAVFLSASLSADVVNTGLCFLFFSLVMSTYISKTPISKGKALTLLGILSLLALTKPVNVLFALLLFAIPQKNFNRKRSYVTFCLTGLGIAIMLAILWNIPTQGMIKTATQALNITYVNPSAQLHGIIHSPLGYLKTLFFNYVVVPGGYQGSETILSFVGVFGWLDTDIPLWTVLLYILVLALTLLYQAGRGAVLKSRQKLMLGSVLVMAFVGNVTAMYLYWTPVGASLIDGVQGRYFISSAILLTGIFTARKKILLIKEETFITLVLSSITIVLSMTALKIFLRYYS